LWIGVALIGNLVKQRHHISPHRMGRMTPSCFSRSISCPPVYSSTKDGWKEPVLRYGRIRRLRIKLWRSVLSLKNNGEIISRTSQPSISDIVTGDRVLKYWHILGMLNHYNTLGTELDVTVWLALERVPLRTQCSAYPTRSWIEDLSRLARWWLRLVEVSVSLCAKRRAILHKPFQSQLWKRLTLEMMCRTRPKESRGYLSVRSRTRCILATNYSTASPLVITLTMRPQKFLRYKQVREEGDWRKEGTVTPLEVVQELLLVVEDRVASVLRRLFVWLSI
jgi:hypothetical protein